MVDRAGQQLGNYRLLSLLGQGGFAEVYLAEHIFLKKSVAVKLLYTQLGKDDLEGFRKEAQTIAPLEHPHIVRVTDFGLDNNLPYLVMEYAPNGTLRHRHPRGTILPLITISSHIKQVVDALQYAHDEKLVHRDIKPENMLLNRHNNILLSDFGLATVAHRTATQNTQLIAGTAVYMAPEMFRGKSYPASDQYALGNVVYKWLTGQPPFNEGDFIQLGYQHTHESPEPISEKIPELSQDVEHVVMTALAKDPKQRFGSVKAFANALEQACMTATTQKEEEIAQPPSSFFNAKEVMQPPNVQNELALLSPLPFPAVQSVPPSQPALTSASTEAITEAIVEKQPQLVTESMPPSVPSEVSTPHPFHEVETSRLVENSLSPAPVQPKYSRRAVLIGLGVVGVAVAVGGSITWFGISRKSTKLQIPVISQTHAISQRLGSLYFTYHGHSGSVRAVAWSSDGQRIASGGLDGIVQVWSAMDGNHIFTYKGRFSYVYAVAWSPDGQRIASGSSDSTVQVWNATDGSQVFIYKGHSDTVNAVAWSPDGKRIASSDSYDIQVWNATDGGRVFTYKGHSGSVKAVAWSPDGKRIASGDGTISGNGTVRVWNATDGSHVFTYSDRFNFVNTVAWSPDGKRIAFGDGSFSDNVGTVQVWNATDGSHVFTYKGHSDAIYAVAWSPDGQRIASGSNDKTVQVWNATDGSHVFTYKGHSSSVNAVAWSPDGQRIASGSIDSTVQVWQAV